MSYGEGTFILGGAYMIGTDEWDTGYCDRCGIVLSIQERIDAILSLTQDGGPYDCDDCMRSYMTSPHGIIQRGLYAN